MDRSAAVELAALPPFARRDAHRHGLSAPEVRAAVRRGELVALRRGVLAGARAERTFEFQVLEQLARVRGTVAASHGTAAVLQDLPRLGRPAPRIRLTRANGTAWSDRDVAVGTADLPAHHLAVVRGIPVTTPARTVVDLARTASLRSGVVLADAAFRRGHAADVRRVLADCRSWPGIAAATQAVDFASPKAESPLESVSRVAMHEWGVPAPELQVEIYDENGFIGRCDFAWRALRVIGEADGLAKYVDADVLRAEKLRQERLERAGWRVVRWTWDDIWHRPAETCARLMWALGRAA